MIAQANPSPGLMWYPPSGYDPLAWGLLLHPGQKVNRLSYPLHLESRLARVFQNTPPEEWEQVIERRLPNLGLTLESDDPMEASQGLVNLILYSSPILELHRERPTPREPEPDERADFLELDLPSWFVLANV